MKFRYKTGLEIFLSLCGVVILSFSLSRSLGKPPSEKHLVSWQQGGAKFHVASPVEIYLLDHIAELWPTRYGPTHPVESYDVPDIYSFLLKQKYSLVDFSLKDLEELRVMAVLTNSRHLETLKSILSIDPSQALANPKLYFQQSLQKNLSRFEVVDKKPCSLIAQEIAFRLFQLEDTLSEEGLRYLRNCRIDKSAQGLNPEAALVHFLDLTVAYENNKVDEVERISQQIKKLSLQAWDADKSKRYLYTRWFSEMSFELASLFQDSLNQQSKDTSI